MSSLYDPAREAFLIGNVDWVADTIYVALIDTADYTFDPSHQMFATEVPSAAKIALGNLTGKTSTNGVADANDVTITNVTGDTVEALILYRQADGFMLAYIDGLSLTPNGGTVNIQWDNGANKIFKL